MRCPAPRTFLLFFAFCFLAVTNSTSSYPSGTCNVSINLEPWRDQLGFCVRPTARPYSSHSNHLSIDMADVKAARRTKFESVFVKIKNELIGHITEEGMPPEAIEWYSDNLQYNVPGGKLNRGMSVVDTVEILKGRELNEDEYFKAAVLGWCIELLQAFFLVSDDIMDSSITRRGQPCWYRKPEIGMIAINDSFMLEGAIYKLIKWHFRSESYYVDLLELFHETTYQTEMGQLVDLITAPEDRVDLSKFSLERHRLIVVYKTAYYSFYLPVACAMLVAKIPQTYQVPPSKTVNPYDIALSILIPLGEYFQIQDDFLDFSGTPEQIGKIGTDIVDNKCSWVVNTAIKLANPTQRKILDENYGRKDAEKENKVKAVFEEIGIRQAYETYEEKAVQSLRRKIDEIVEVDGGLRRQVFESFLGKIYKRSK
ncbi:isoprenoid synthase domain-containing protein [Crepidotus variabilis]|uniref:(2E,6E)-farnesyl diphosphate synthase n=1 Tax=Crepidotus variabilis TaxID=179855 RepID=A0A9P6ECF8_9AGAR|nr:isoprenoid synthase domain-containing protein [Crepidotus variabilis]